MYQYKTCFNIDSLRIYKICIYVIIIIIIHTMHYTKCVHIRTDTLTLCHCSILAQNEQRTVLLELLSSCEPLFIQLLFKSLYNGEL